MLAVAVAVALALAMAMALALALALALAAGRVYHCAGCAAHRARAQGRAALRGRA